MFTLVRVTDGVQTYAHTFTGFKNKEEAEEAAKQKVKEKEEELKNNGT